MQFPLVTVGRFVTMLQPAFEVRGNFEIDFSGSDDASEAEEPNP
jgi:hypothetical protein